MLATLNEVHAGQWSRVEHLLATIVDALGVVSHHALVGSHIDPKKLRSVKPPNPLPRPGGQRRPRRKATSGDLRRVFSAVTYDGS